MKKIKPLGPDAEVLGAAINGFVNAVNSNNILPHAEKLGMTDLDPNKWYPKQMYIDLWNSIISSNSQAMFDLVSIGMTIAENAWPPELEGQPFDELIMGFGDGFNAVNRGADRGYVKTMRREPNQYALAFRTPDPDDIHYGVVYGFCKRFLPKGKTFTVQYDTNITRRDEGGDETVILVIVGS